MALLLATFATHPGVRNLGKKTAEIIASAVFYWRAYGILE